MSNTLRHRRSSVFVDEYVDKFSLITIGWNGVEKIQLTMGRDSVEIVSEEIVPNPNNPKEAVLDNPTISAYRNDVASLTLSVAVAEDLAVSLLKMIGQVRKRAAEDGAS